jgi:HAD superfamily hydrolase (TIGR01490 family)
MQNLALFDLDHTLLPIDTGHQWGRFMVASGMVDGESFARQVEQFHADYQAGTLDMPAYLRMVLAPLAAYSRAQLNAWREQFMREVVEPAILPEALALVRRHRDNGDLCCLVTATNDFVTAPIAKAFGFHGLVATQAETVDGDPESAYTGKPAGIPSFGAGKIARTEVWLASLGKAWSDFGRSWFYSDSRNDIPLLERVTDPVATNPDPTLRAHAQQAGWPILELFGQHAAAGSRLAGQAVTG